ncbi:MAG TPA: transposase [Paraburkholderia sp.]|uniref:transposase n=1 Tax=Paraburkholderia sp. TaxID=1926495 RepID=UPI002ED01AE1
MAVHPASARHYQGIECIVNKMVTHHVPMPLPTPNEKWPFPVEFQSVLLSEGGRTLDQLLPDRADASQMSALELPLEPGQPRQMIELAMPYRLDENDRRALQEILPSLPPLQYPISDADQAAFLDAWFRLKERLAWEPVLVTTAYVERRKAAQPAARAEHQQALQEEFKSGRIEALNGHHVPVSVLMGSSFISRQQAIAYLERRGFSYVSAELAAGAEAKNGPVAPEAERKRESKGASVGTRVREKQPPANPRAEEGDSKRAKKIELTGSESSGKNNSGASVARMAQEHGINANLLRKWITKYLMEREKGVSPTPQDNGDELPPSGDVTNGVALDLPGPHKLIVAATTPPAFVPVVSVPPAPTLIPPSPSMTLALHVRLSNGVELELGEAIATIDELTTLVQILGRMSCCRSTTI